MHFLKLALVAISVGSAVAVPVLEVRDNAVITSPEARDNTVVTSLETRDNTIVTSLINAIGAVTPLINSQLASINSNIVNGAINGGAVPAVQSLLNNLITTLNTLTNSVTAIVNNVVFPLASGELNNIPTLVSNVLNLVVSIGNTLLRVALASTPDILKTLGSEISAAANLIQPFVNPVITFLNAVLQNVTKLGPLATIISGLLSTITNIVSGIVKPIITALNN